MSEQGVVAIIPARGGSRRLPRKNLYPFFGRPLLEYAIMAAKQSAAINRGIYVSTEDREIASWASRLGAAVIDRPAALAADNVWTQDVLQHAVRYLEGVGVSFDVVSRLHCSPQIQASQIDAAISLLRRQRRWEVFSVNQTGVEDGVIHVLTKNTVWQQALSVYQGIITTNCVDIHTKDDIDQLVNQRINRLERHSHQFLRQLQRTYNHRSLWHEMRYLLGKPRTLWRWQEVVRLRRRWQAILDSSAPLQDLLARPDCAQRARQMAVLDLGCGFGMYWPLLRFWGFRTFVGIDLFDLRQPQDYWSAARAYVGHFCADCQTQLIMDDARNLSKHKLIVPKFDVILNVATLSTKLNSTAIPLDVAQKIQRDFGAPNSLLVHVPQVPPV